jgi:hypothetical protein
MAREGDTKAFGTWHIDVQGFTIWIIAQLLPQF